MDFIRLLEQSSPMVWLREGGSIWGYPAVLFMHTLGLGAVAGVSAAIDLRVLGFGRRIPLHALLPMFRLVWIALAIASVSGLILLIADASNKLATPVFYVKMLFVVLAVVCVRRQRAEMAMPDTGAGASASRGWAFASLFCWVAAITAGRLIAYMGPLSGLG
jgi:hypothetical protein